MLGGGAILKDMRKSTAGFTIVELLIVIIVIAILAAISIVAYNGIQNMASDAAVQAEINQAYKQGEVARVEEKFSGFGEEQMLDYLESNIKLSMRNYHQSETYPFLVLMEYDWQTQSKTLNVAAVSKSGKVFIATHENGGVSRSITSWTEYRENLQASLDYYDEILADPPEWCDSECVEFYHEDRTYVSSELQRVSSRESQGDDYWYAGRGGCGVGTVMGDGEEVYLYKASEQRWVSAVDEGLYGPC